MSYCCTTNVANTIKQHNSKVLNDDEKNDNKINQCNCGKKEKCPMEGVFNEMHCLQSGSNNEQWKFCVFWCFRRVQDDHTKSFKLIDDETNYDLKWSIAAHASPYKCGTRRCDLCLAEKVIIVRSEHRGLLNKRTELISKCRHRNKYILNSLK